MKTITIELLNDNAIHLLQDLELLNIIRIPTENTNNDDLIIPEWHKEIVRERRKNTKPEDYIDWNTMMKKLEQNA